MLRFLIGGWMVLATGIVGAQDFVFRAPHSLAIPGTDTEITVIFDSTVGGTSDGFSFGLCSDELVVTPIDVDTGIDLASVNSGQGPDFFSESVEAGGITVGCVISLLGSNPLPAGVLEVVDVSYTPIGVIGDLTDLLFCDNLGTPQVTTIVVSSGASLVPDTENGSIELVSVTATEFSLAPTGPAIPGETLEVGVQITNPFPTHQFQFGVTAHPNDLVFTGAAPSARVAAMNGGGGPDVFIVDLSPPGGIGVTIECTISTSAPFEELPPGNNVELATLSLAVANIAGPPCTVLPIEFTSTLGSPAIAPEVSTALGQVITPGTEDAFPLVSSFTPSPPTGGITIVAPDRVFSPGAIATVPITLDSDTALRALSFGLTYDDTDFTLASTALGSSLAAVRCGAGPEFSVSSIHSSPAGFSFAMLVALQPPFTDLDVIPGSEIELVELEFTTSSSPTTAGTDLTFTGTLGSPPIPLEVTVGTTALTPDVIDGSITFGDGFNRGDCNTDGDADIADAVFALLSLFGGGAAPACADSCDANDDGQINIADPIFTLSYLFTFGMIFPDPIVCGGDPTPDALDCVSYPPCS